MTIRNLIASIRKAKRQCKSGREGKSSLLNSLDEEEEGEKEEKGEEEAEGKAEGEEEEEEKRDEEDEEDEEEAEEEDEQGGHIDARRRGGRKVSEDQEMRLAVQMQDATVIVPIAA
ncbi:hypothetical protein BGX27_006480, partial [Mortierella sp. AM989]